MKWALFTAGGGGFMGMALGGGLATWAGPLQHMPANAIISVTIGLVLLVIGAVLP